MCACSAQTRQSSLPALAAALWAARNVQPPAAQSNPSSKRRGGRRKKAASEDTAAAAGPGSVQGAAPAAPAAPAWQAGASISPAPAAGQQGAALAAFGNAAQPMLQASAGLAALMGGAAPAALGGLALGGGGIPGLQLPGGAQPSFSFVQALTQVLRVSRKLHTTLANLLSSCSV